MSSIINSLKIEEIAVKDNPNVSLFVFRHLPTTMGVTIGNYLRRLLGRFVSGLAPVAVAIADRNGSVASKFTRLSGVIETTPYFVVNLRNVIVEQKENKEEEIFCLELKLENKEKKEKIVTAGDFQKVKGIKIKNPDLYLATLAAASDGEKNPRLEVKLYFRRSWGHYEAKEQKKSEWWKKNFADEENIISLDTDYSPVKSGYEGEQINFEVENIVVGLNKEEEQLKLTVVTNGAVKPRDALLEVLQMSQNLCGKVVNSISEKKKEIAVEE